MKANQAAHDNQLTENHSIRSSEHFALNISDPTKPRTCSCKSCCSLCDWSHCCYDGCPERTTPTKEETLGSNVPAGLSPPSESERVISNEGKGPEGTRSFYEGQPRHSSPTTIENEEESGVSDVEINSVVRRWSRADLALPSSKTSIPSMDKPRSPDAKVRDSTAVSPAENRLQEALSSGKEVPDVLEKPPNTQPGQQQNQHLGSVHEEKRWPEIRNKLPKEERRGQSEPAPPEPYILGDDDALSVQERPSPYVPIPPFGGPGGRRRPRRPHSKTAW
ncbi:hypothetical protein F4803DRAFT_58223 [Xylaria telfairii]|nr:hypothetical protein F4803DRAFT_58223 [Xylaria telfairii]